MRSLWLPSEVWTLVFRYISFSDRLRVRSSCRYLRDVMDGSAVWTDWAVDLSGGEREEEGFWSMLRRFSVLSAWVTEADGSTFTRVAKRLPGLRTLIIEKIGPFDLTFQDLTVFPNLVDLKSGCNLFLKDLHHFFPHCMTERRLCAPDFSKLPAEIPPDLPFKDLQSLALHCSFFLTHPVNVLHFFVSSLPQLQHLSMTMSTGVSFQGSISDFPPLHDSPLSSLELVACDTRMLPDDLMEMLRTLPFLRSLGVICHTSSGICYDNASQKLSTWLRDLPALKSLLLFCPNFWNPLISSLPRSLTRFVLMPDFHGSWIKILPALSARLPDLRHFFIEPDLGADMALIPRFFPKLKTLGVHHKEVPEDAFLSLASLKELEILETRDAEPLPAALFTKLTELTNNRVWIKNRCEKVRDRPSCSCLGTTHYWF